MRALRRTSSQMSCLSLRAMRRSNSTRSHVRDFSRMDEDSAVCEDSEDDDSLYEAWIDFGDKVGFVCVCLLSVYLSVHVFFHMFACCVVHLFVCLVCVCLCVCPHVSNLCLALCLSVVLSIYLSVYVSVHVSV